MPISPASHLGIILREQSLKMAMYENHRFSTVFIPAKMRKSYSLNESPLEVCPFTVLCGPWKDTEVIQWRVTRPSPSGRWLPAWWWSHCSRPERSERKRRGNSMWLEPKVRIRSHPFWVCQGRRWDWVFKIMMTSDLTGPEFAACMHCDSAPSSVSGTSLFVLGALLWANLSPNSHPNARQRGQWNHSFLVLVNRYLLALWWSVRY